MSNAYVEVAHTKVTSNVSAVDLANCMSDTYMNYYLVCANVTLDADGGYAITGKVSNTAKTSTDCNHAGRFSDMGGGMGRAITSTFGGQTTYIMAQRSYNFQTALTGNNSLLEGYLFNIRSSSQISTQFTIRLMLQVILTIDFGDTVCKVKMTAQMFMTVYT